MSVRAKQKEETRGRVVAAAVEAFAELGFRAASTRDIAERAGIKQGLVTYHFATKDDLWRAAVDLIFKQMNEELSALAGLVDTMTAKPLAREAIRIYTRFVARHPELFRIMISEGNSQDDRMRWLVDTHLKPLYDGFRNLVGPAIPGSASPHVFYAVAGAASTIFAVAPECKRLTSLNPTTKQAIEAHADFVASLLIP